MENLIHYDACPGCGGEQINFVLKAKDYTVSREIYEIWECADCSLRFTQNVPNAHDIGHYYKSEQYVSHTDTNKGFINKIYHFVRQKTLKQKVKLLQKASGLSKGNLLDIGAGVGAFASQAKQKGWNVTALEPDADARKIAKEKFGVDALPSNEIFSLPSETFDAITLWHVLEHVHELHDYVKSFVRLLSKNGVLIVAVPNYTSYDAQKYKQFWAAYDVPRHLYHFSPKSLETLMNMHDLDVIEMLPMKYDSYYVSMLSEKYKYGKNKYLAAFLSGLKSNKNAAEKPEKFSSVIYIIKKK